MPTDVQPAAEFQSLPLEYFVSTPLLAAIKAQHALGTSTLHLLSQYFEGGKPKTMGFTVTKPSADGSPPSRAEVTVPLVSLVPMPYLRIERLNVDFEYEVRHSFEESEAMRKQAAGELATGPALSPFGSVSLRGSIASESSKETTTNRSGTLKVGLTASEAPIPEGLARVLSMLASSVGSSPGKP